MIEGLNFVIPNLEPLRPGTGNSPSQNTEYGVSPQKILKDAVEVYPGVEMSTDTLEKIQGARLGLRAPSPSSMKSFFSKLFNKGKVVVDDVVKETKKIETEDVVIEAGMQIKDWYDTHKSFN